jgi:gliding motility-associated-like protein
MKQIYTLILFFFAIVLIAQTNGVERIVIASGGNGDVTIGETIIGTSPNNGSGNTTYFLLGFQQPELLSKTQNPTSDVYSVSGNLLNQVSCKGNKDGKYRLNLLHVKGKITIELLDINKGKLDLLVKQKSFNVTAVEYPIDGLTKGNYSAIVTYESATDTIVEIELFEITELDIQCANLNPVSGITPNDDGVNDAWIIDGITNFKDNEVEIFNRWGQTVWSGKGYNNKDVVFKGFSNQDKKLNDGTFFYVILPDKELKPLKGWLEIITP